MPPTYRKAKYAVAFGRVIHKLRDDRRWKIVDMAPRANLHPTTLSVLERGGNTPSLNTIFWLASVFNMRPSELVRLVEDELRVNTPASARSTPPSESSTP
jgi:transcriptional regulator with XRE-family HTH domain